MKINNFDQSFGARIIMNDSFKKAIEATRDANNVGCFNQVAQFINALRVIKNTNEFDTFEVQVQSLEEQAKNRYSSIHPFEIKIDGKSYDCSNVEVMTFFGDQQSRHAIAGIIGFAKDFFGLDFNLPIGKNHDKYLEIYADIRKHQEQISELEKEADKMRGATAGEYEIKLNKLI